MRKKEFLNELDYRLRNIDNTERSNILNYYEELIDDKIDAGNDEEKVIRNLGTIDEIMRKLNITSEESKSKIKYESLINEEIEKEKNRNPKEEKNETKPVNKVKSEPKKKSNSPSVMMIILLVLLFPLWISLFSVLFSLVITGICLIIAFCFAGIGVVIAGFSMLIGGIIMFSVSPAIGFILLGGGLVTIGVGLILTPLTLKAGIFIFKQATKGLASLIKSFTKGGN